MREINKIILHCSDSNFGNAALIDKWHKERGFAEIGYHFVICNGFLTAKSTYQPELDGLTEAGRSILEAGAHCSGLNAGSIGICLIGKHLFTGNQLLSALPKLLQLLAQKYAIKPYAIYGHYEFNRFKTCPNLDMPMIRSTLLTLGGKTA